MAIPDQERVGKAMGMVAQILVFSRQSKPECKPIEMRRLVKEVTKLLSSTIPATICLKEDVAADVARVNPGIT
jgi:hypothetical protein